MDPIRPEPGEMGQGARTRAGLHRPRRPKRRRGLTRFLLAFTWHSTSFALGCVAGIFMEMAALYFAWGWE